MKDSKIEWTHHTFNPWLGCTKVTPGCDNCYAANMEHRFGRAVWGPHGTRPVAGEAKWKEPRKWDREAAAAEVRQRVFCASMGDVFEVRKDLVAPRQRLLNLIEETPNLDWLLLTKRPNSIRPLLPAGYEFPSQVWIGTTIENQEQAHKRVAYLQDFVTPAVRFLSCEPLLGPVDIRKYLQPGRNGVRIDWVICGGESEHGARPMNPEWAESLLQQCQEAGVPFLFKQWGNWGPTDHVDAPTGGRKRVQFLRQDGSQVDLVRVGKKATGRELLGRTWTEFPPPI